MGENESHLDTHPSRNYQYIYYLNQSGGMGDWLWAENWFGPNAL